LIGKRVVVPLLLRVQPAFREGLLQVRVV